MLWKISERAGIVWTRIEQVLIVRPVEPLKFIKLFIEFQNILLAVASHFSKLSIFRKDDI